MDFWHTVTVYLPYAVLATTRLQDVDTARRDERRGKAGATDLLPDLKDCPRLVCKMLLWCSVLRFVWC